MQAGTIGCNRTEVLKILAASIAVLFHIHPLSDHHPFWPAPLLQKLPVWSSCLPAF